MAQNSVLITGATAGIGWEAAIAFARAGYRVIGTGRRAERLAALQKIIEDEGGDFTPLSFDIRESAQCHAALDGLPAEHKKVDVLVNNAGLAIGLAPINQGDFEHWDRMMETNVMGLLYVSKIVGGWMVEQKSGHIINIASVAGKEVYPNGNVYCATKHAVDAITQAMRIDLLPYGIKVTGIYPGMVETEFSIVRFEGDRERAKQPYKGIEPLHPQDIADSILWAVGQPAHVQITELHITPAAQATARDVRREG